MQFNFPANPFHLLNIAYNGWNVISNFVNESEIAPHGPGGDTGKSSCTNLNSGFFKSTDKRSPGVKSTSLLQEQFSYHVLSGVSFDIICAILPPSKWIGWQFPSSSPAWIVCSSQVTKSGNYSMSVMSREHIKRGKLYLLTQRCSHSASLIYPQFLIPPKSNSVLNSGCSKKVKNHSGKKQRSTNIYCAKKTTPACPYKT